ncbi:MAG: DUF3102 domain-containing protein [Desulfobulbus sp.]
MTKKNGHDQSAADSAEIKIYETNQGLQNGLQEIDQQKLEEADRKLALQSAEIYLDGREYDLPSLTAEINMRIGFITTAYIEIGRMLLAIKIFEGHGNFTKWLEANFPLSPRQARNFMKVAARLEQDPGLGKLAKGGIKQAMILLDLPEEDLEEIKKEDALYGKPLEEWQLKTNKELAEELEKERKNRDKIIAEETKTLRSERDGLQEKCNDLEKFAPVDDQSPEWCLEHFAELSKAVRDAVALRRRFMHDDRLKEDLPTQAKIEAEFMWMRKELDLLEREWIDTFTPEI